MQLPARNSSFASRREPSKESRESIMDGLFPFAAVRVSSLVNSFKDASMVKVGVTNCLPLCSSTCPGFYSATNLEA